MSGHEAFSKAQKKQADGHQAIVGGSALLAHGAASAPLMRTGRKTPTKMVSASPKRQAGRYQAELVGAMKTGKVDSNSTLRVLKTPSGRYLNAGGTHRQIAREAMGVPTKKIEVKELGFEPRQSAYQAVKRKASIARLEHASRKAAAGKPVRPVSPGARKLNVALAQAADTNDDNFWHGLRTHKGVGTPFRNAAKMAHGAQLGSAAIAGVLGAGVLATGIHERNKFKSKQKVGKAMTSGHEAFEISKRTRDTSLGRDVTGALFPGIHGAIAGKPGHKVKAAAYELGGNLVLPTVGAGIGTHIASQHGHYVKLPKRGRTKKVSKAMAVAQSSKPGKKVQVAHPPEVQAYIENKKAELSKSATGHEAFLLEDVEKAFSLGGAVGAVRNAGKIAAGVVKSPGVLKPAEGAHRGAGKVAGMVHARPKTAMALGGAGVAGTGYTLGRSGRH